MSDRPFRQPKGSDQGKHFPDIRRTELRDLRASRPATLARQEQHPRQSSELAPGPHSRLYTALEQRLVQMTAESLQNGSMPSGEHHLSEKAYNRVRDQLRSSIQHQHTDGETSPRRPERIGKGVDGERVRGHAQGNAASWEKTCGLVSLEQMINWYVPEGRIRELTGGAPRVTEKHLVESIQKEGHGFAHVMDQVRSGHHLLITDDAARTFVLNKEKITDHGVIEVCREKNPFLPNGDLWLITMEEARKLEKLSKDGTLIQFFQERGWVVGTNDVEKALNDTQGSKLPKDIKIFINSQLGGVGGDALLQIARDWDLPMHWEGNVLAENAQAIDTAKRIAINPDLHGDLKEGQVSLGMLAKHANDGPVLIFTRGLPEQAPKDVPPEGGEITHAVIVHKAFKEDGKWFFRINDSDSRTRQGAFLTRSATYNLDIYTGENRPYSEDVLEKIWLKAYNPIAFNDQAVRIYANMFTFKAPPNIQLHQEKESWITS